MIFPLLFVNITDPYINLAPACWLIWNPSNKVNSSTPSSGCDFYINRSIFFLPIMETFAQQIHFKQNRWLNFNSEMVEVRKKLKMFKDFMKK